MSSYKEAMRLWWNSTERAYLPSLVFDESSSLLSYSSPIGVKVVSAVTDVPSFTTLTRLTTRRHNKRRWDIVQGGRTNVNSHDVRLLGTRHDTQRPTSNSGEFPEVELSRWGASILSWRSTPPMNRAGGGTSTLAMSFVH